MPTEAWIYPLHGRELPARSLVGAKAMNLMRLARAGYDVPEGFCLTTAAFAATLRSLQVGNADAESVRQAILAASLPRPVTTALSRAHAALAGRGFQRLAVRSSSTAEDSETDSWAGQTSSYLNVVGFESLVEHVRRCWASLFRTESLLYLGQAALDEDVVRMAVVVQRVVAAEKAGVLFTVHPVTGERGQLVVSSAFGLGETVVGGRACDTYTLDKATGAVVTRELGAKTDMLRPASGDGTSRVAVAREKARRDSLDAAELRKLAAAARRVETDFGAPQDVEWAFERGRLYVLQTRPITAGRGVAAANRRRVELWSNVNVGEALPGVGTPLTWSLIRAFSRRGFEQAFGSLGLKVPRDYAMVGSFRGRVYLNLTQFMSIASQIPFFPPERLLNLAGGGAGLALSLPNAYERRSAARFLLHLPLTLLRMAFSQVVTPWRARRWVPVFAARRDRFLRSPIEQRSPVELAAELEFVTSLFNRTGTLMLACASNALSSYVAVLGWLNTFAGPEVAAAAQKKLFSGLSGMASAAPGLGLVRLAQFVRARPALERLFRGHPPAALMPLLAADADGRAFLEQLRGFLAEHGRRAAREAELSTPRWHEDPTFVLGVVQQHLAAPNLTDPDERERAQADLRARTTDDVRRRLRRGTRWLFGPLLRLAHDASRLREEMRGLVVDSLGMYRRLFLEAGSRLVAAGQARAADDVFFLTRDEVRAFLEARADADLPLRITMRRTLFETYRTAPDPPDHFLLNAGEMVVSDGLDEAGGRELRGTAGAHGRATGRARVVRDPREGAALQPGEILVAPYTDVGWTPLFLVAAAVVTDLGGPLSHSCVVAREYGIPAVVSVHRATRRIRTGDRITVDGDRGLVVLYPPSEAALSGAAAGDAPNGPEGSGKASRVAS